MGEWFTFVCDDCAYEAEVSGGPDAGMLVTVETMSCSDCHSAGSTRGRSSSGRSSTATTAALDSNRRLEWGRPVAIQAAGRGPQASWSRANVSPRRRRAAYGERFTQILPVTVSVNWPDAKSSTP